MQEAGKEYWSKAEPGRQDWLGTRVHPLIEAIRRDVTFPVGTWKSHGLFLGPWSLGGKTLLQTTYLLVCELLCMNQLRLLSTYMAQALSSLPSMASLRTSMRATPKAGSGWLS